MSINYFSLPLKPKKIIANAEHGKCNIKESIAHYLHLITTSYFGECTFDDSFGCSIWDVDFDNLSSTNKIKEIISMSLLESLKTHEKRLTKINIEITIKQEEIQVLKKSNVVKKKVLLRILATIKKTNEEFLYNEYFYIGPLSY